MWTLVQLCRLWAEEDGLGLGNRRAHLRLSTWWRVARRPGSFLGGVGGWEEETWVRLALPEGAGGPSPSAEASTLALSRSLEGNLSYDYSVSAQDLVSPTAHSLCVCDNSHGVTRL